MTNPSRHDEKEAVLDLLEQALQLRKRVEKKTRGTSLSHAQLATIQAATRRLEEITESFG